MYIRPRTYLALLALPLTAFTCFPKPNSTLIVQPTGELSQLYAYPETEEGKAIMARLRSFASQYALLESNCKGVWPSWDTEAPCFAFTRSSDEGIGLYFSARKKSQRWEVLLVKERRVFGTHSIGEIEDHFDTAVKQPLLQALGEQRVQLR